MLRPLFTRRKSSLTNGCKDGSRCGGQQKMFPLTGIEPMSYPSRQRGMENIKERVWDVYTQSELLTEASE
jgi:hypothetical protein